MLKWYQDGKLWCIHNKENEICFLLPHIPFREFLIHLKCFRYPFPFSFLPQNVKYAHHFLFCTNSMINVYDFKLNKLYPLLLSLTVCVSWTIYNMQNNKWFIKRRDYFKNGMSFSPSSTICLSLIIDSWICESWV